MDDDDARPRRQRNSLRFATIAFTLAAALTPGHAISDPRIVRAHFETNAVAGSSADQPRVRVSLSLTRDGEPPHVFTLEDERYVAVCSLTRGRPDSTQGWALRCWWAGAGDDWSLRVRGRIVEIVRVELNEERPPHTRVIGHFSLLPGEVVQLVE